MADGVAAILKRILATYDNDPKWRGADFACVKNISNTQVGDVGQDFVVALCEKYDFESGTAQRRSSTPSQPARGAAGVTKRLLSKAWPSTSSASPKTPKVA